MVHGGIVRPTLTNRIENGIHVPVLVWSLARPMRAIASAALGGGLGHRDWVINATVPLTYDRHDPDVHLGEMAARLGLSGAGVGLMTAVDVARYVEADDGGVLAVLTVGLSEPTWAAAPDGDPDHRPSTINAVITVPVRLSDAALVNAIATVAEAKAQALRELGVAGTGTATDATCVLCPVDGPAEPYGGPRSTWGARIARAVHAGVRAGGAAWLAAR
jgi:adenosylcobinamide amidohydrolase